MDPNSMGIDQHLAYLIPIFGILFFVGIAILIVPLWQICKKAGFSPWLSLLAIIPTLGVLILLYILAFSQWKVAPLPQYAGGYPPAYPPAYPPTAYPPAAPPANPGDPYPRG